MFQLFVTLTIICAGMMWFNIDWGNFAILEGKHEEAKSRKKKADFYMKATLISGLLMGLSSVTLLF